MAPGWEREIDALADEIDGVLPLTLWRALRTVRAWSSASGEERAQLFQTPSTAVRERFAFALAEAPELMEGLAGLALVNAHPLAVTESQVADACAHVSRWAEERSLALTAMHFAEAAALADPEDASRALDAARACKRTAANERAAVWYERGFRLAVRGKRRTECCRALLGYGDLLKTLGQTKRARRLFERAAQRARHTGRRRQAAEAHHDLLGLAAEGGDFRQGLRHVRAALDLYPAPHPRLPMLVHDWAVLLVRTGCPSAALPFLRLTCQVELSDPNLRALAWGTLAGAAGSARQRDLYEEAAMTAQTLVGIYAEFAPAVFLNLAEGAAALDDRDRATRFAHTTVKTAKLRGDTVPQRLAARLLERLEQDRPVISGDDAEPPDPESVGRLLERCAARLRAWQKRRSYR